VGAPDPGRRDVIERVTDDALVAGEPGLDELVAE
jgi:hypothetical protein